MKLRNHSDPVNSAARATAMFEIIYLDGTDAGDMPTQPIAPLVSLDEQLDELRRFGERLITPDVDSEDNEDGL